MENIKNEHAQRTEKLILSVFDYCQANDLKIWSAGSSFFNKYVIGTERDLNDANNSPFNPGGVNEVTKEDIVYSPKYFIYKPGNNEKNITIEAFREWMEDIDDNRYINLYVHVFLENDNEIAKHFANDWFKVDIDLTKVLEYSDKKYPRGFLDKKIISYDSVKNWNYFIDTLDENKLIKFWQNEKSLDTFVQGLKALDPNGEKHIADFFLNNLTDKLCKAGLSEDAKLKTSYILMDLIPNNIQEKYINNFPFLQNLIDAKNKDNLFLQNEEEITEKCLILKSHIYDYFKFVNLKASQYDNIAMQALKFIGENEQLYNNGLICANVFSKDKELLFFASLTDNKLINRNSIKNLFINSLETFFNHDEVNLSGNHGGVDNREILRRIINTNIEHWILKEELSNKDIEKSARRKQKI
jgi:hypothetical protein